MVREKCGGLVGSKVTRERFRIGAQKIDQDETVQDAAELGVDVEPQDLAAKPQVLLEEDRNAFLIGLEIRHDAGDLLDVVEKTRHRQAGIPSRA